MKSGTLLEDISLGRISFPSSSDRAQRIDELEARIQRLESSDHLKRS